MLSKENQKMVDIMSTMENGRFKRLIDAINISDECFKCCYFNFKEKCHNKCASIPTCFGSTLSRSTKSYLLWKLGIITQDEHFQRIGFGKYNIDGYDTGEE